MTGVYVSWMYHERCELAGENGREGYIDRFVCTSVQSKQRSRMDGDNLLTEAGWCKVQGKLEGRTKNMLPFYMTDH